MTRTAGAQIGCQRQSRFWGLGCPKIYHEAEDTLVLLFRDECLSLFEQRLLFGEFGFLMGKPHLLIGKKMIFFFENPPQIGRRERRWSRGIRGNVRRRFHGTNYNIIICLSHQKVAS
ncbi:hypothetical protein [Thiolapillus sp.]|uniref:hypothetical protein n=1 Tax=Thiolapillus sp. TaxID=2017437 RepID=UPI00263B9160|nr:hypothetical protein [Thiolapillus sp.]